MKIFSLHISNPNETASEQARGVHVFSALSLQEAIGRAKALLARGPSGCATTMNLFERTGTHYALAWTDPVSAG